MKTKVNPPFWFWICTVISVLWYANSAINFFVKDCQWGKVISGDTIGIGIAGIFGFIASVFLLLKKSTAFIGFVISFIGLLIQIGYWIFELGSSLSVTYPLIMLAIGISMIFLSKRAKSKAWII